jgi:PadR family transcriptional regulator
MSIALRFSRQSQDVLGALLRSPSRWRYGYDLSLETGLKSGTLYPILMRLADRGALETRWETSEEQGRPPRHMYRLTGAGIKLAREKVRPREPRLRTALAEEEA